MSTPEVQQVALHLPLPLLKKDLDDFLVSPCSTRQSTKVREVLSVRDQNPGNERACIVCGCTEKLKTTRITISDELFLKLWKSWVREGFLPDTVNSPVKEPRNALTFCKNHSKEYNEYRFFIRWVPEWQIYVFVNLRTTTLDYHGTVVKLDPQSPSAPLPFLLLAHEARARTHWPLSSIEPITNWPEPSFQFANTSGLCFSVPNTVWCSLHRTRPLLLNVPTPPYTVDSMNFRLHLPNLSSHESKSATTITLGSGTTAFDTTIKARDIFQGDSCCIVCGFKACGRNTPIVPHQESELWADLQANGLIPKDKVKSIKHDPRNGIRLCFNHHGLFVHYRVFIRYIPEIGQFVTVNHSGNRSVEEIHGMAIYLKSGVKHSPFSSLFLVHEMRVRGVWCTRGDRMVSKSPRYHTIFSAGVGGCSRSAGKSSSEDDDNNSDNDGGHVSDVNNGDRTVTALGQTRVSLNPADLQALVTATRRQPAWKSYLVENETWSGTALENIAKYKAINEEVDQAEANPVTFNLW